MGLLVGSGLLLALAGCGGGPRGAPVAGGARSAAGAAARPAQAPTGQAAGRPAEPPTSKPSTEPTQQQSRQPAEQRSGQLARPLRPAPSPRARAGMMSGRGMMAGGGMMGGMMGQPADTAAAPTASLIAATAPGCPDVSPALVDLGRRVFTGSGNCYACHGSDAHGTTLAPNLADTTWLNVDGSYAAIAALVRAGVPHPKKYPAPMPAMGGAQLSTEQICAVAAYVHGLGGGR
jgi:mono/diheme cytochrome c family protein